MSVSVEQSKIEKDERRRVSKIDKNLWDPTKRSESIRSENSIKLDAKSNESVDLSNKSLSKSALFCAKYKLLIILSSALAVGMVGLVVIVARLIQTELNKKGFKKIFCMNF